MDDKKMWFKMLGYVVGCFVGGILLIGFFVWLIDPFYHYHAPVMNMPVILDSPVYQTAGAAKNLFYDSAIVGTSMTENMHSSWFDEGMGWKTVKLSYSGARTDDLKAILGEINERDGKIENIVMDINDYQLTVDSWTKYTERPEYLYDEYLYNDFKYLYNHDVLVRCVERCIDGLLGIEDNVDLAYTWEDESLFAKEIACASCVDRRNELIFERSGVMYQSDGAVSGNLEEKLKICQENLDNVIPFIEEHPDTQMHIFIPPYSMLYWEEKVLSGTLEDMIAIYAHAIKKLLQYENVKIYYFQDEENIITDLDNYRDNCHHKPEYNYYMFECIRDGKNMITLDNYVEKLTGMYEFAVTYPYVQMWE